jgi:hypothetical protein
VPFTDPVEKIEEKGRKRMHRRISRICRSFSGFIFLGVIFLFMHSCGDSGDQVIDEATGNRALKQYEMTKDKIKTIEEKQQERYKDILPGAAREERPDE